MIKQAIAIGLSWFLMVGCSTPSGLSGETADALSKTAGGNSSAEASTKPVNIGTAASYMGEASNAPTHASLSRTASVSGAGDVLQAFSFAASTTVERTREYAQNDPIVLSLTAELAGTPVEDTVRKDQLRAALAARMEQIEGAMVAAGG